MDRKLYSTWMTIAALVLGLVGLAMILVSIFDSGAGTLALILGLLFVAAGTVLNIIRMRELRRSGKAGTDRRNEHV